MNFLGKILTWLILVMSLIFMMASVAVYATHQAWRDKSKALEGQLTDARTKNDQLQSKQDELKNVLALERAARASSIAALETREQELSLKVQQVTQELQKAQSEEATRIAMLDNAQKAQVALSTETSRLREEVLAAQQARDEIFRRAVALEDDLNSKKNALERLQRRDEELSSRLAYQNLLLQKGGLSEADALTDVPPRRDGVVTAVRENNRWVEISLGTDEGLRMGHQLDIHRPDGTYLGRVVVRRAMTDKLVSEVLPDFRRGQIREGDRAITKVR